MQDKSQKPRWQYRFDNYKRAFTLLREAIEWRQERELTDLEKEGTIQRFEYTWELAWKTLKDYLENEGVVLEKITPKAVLIASVEAKIIHEPDIWMQALDDSSLELSIDVLAYPHVHYPPLKRHIDENTKQLFSPSEIKADSCSP